MTALEGKALLDHGNAIARRYAARLGADVADELRAEAVARALGRPPPDGRMEPWLERIYRNLFVDLWRRRRARTVELGELADLAGTGTPEEDLLRRERRRAVRRGLGRLPRDVRRALLSRYWSELDDRIVAERAGVATATVRTRIHRALARLRARLDDLRAWCPPLFGKLGTQAATVGLAPVIVAALIVVGAAAPLPEPAPAATPALASIRPPAAPTPGPAAPAEPAVTETPALSVRIAKRTRSRPPAALALLAPPQIVETDDPPIRSEILQPDGIVIFAEPERVAPPSMVAAPPDLLAQIDKMIEEYL
jgi:RNA polymerase sigma factor (sigma-70 family)